MNLKILTFCRFQCLFHFVPRSGHDWRSDSSGPRSSKSCSCSCPSCSLHQGERSTLGQAMGCHGMPWDLGLTWTHGHIFRIRIKTSHTIFFCYMFCHTMFCLGSNSKSERQDPEDKDKEIQRLLTCFASHWNFMVVVFVCICEWFWSSPWLGIVWGRENAVWINLKTCVLGRAAEILPTKIRCLTN